MFASTVAVCSVLLALGAGAIIGCGGHMPAKQPTTSTISITGVSGSTTHATSVILIVQ